MPAKGMNSDRRLARPRVVEISATADVAMAETIYRPPEKTDPLRSWLDSRPATPADDGPSSPLHTP